jgi:hypothetical protein
MALRPGAITCHDPTGTLFIIIVLIQQVLDLTGRHPGQMRWRNMPQKSGSRMKILTPATKISYYGFTMRAGAAK